MRSFVRDFVNEMDTVEERAALGDVHIKLVITLELEGVEGDGFLKLKAGQAAPGLSGAPLVCPSRRAVVGVVTASRDIDSDLGGWASPISALLTGGSGVPADLLALGETLGRANRAAVLTDRTGWHRVLPVNVDGVLDQPWARFERRSRSSPTDLLRADFAVVPYLFRDRVVADVDDWCEQPAEPMAITLVAARGGAGKTRFAIELCRRLAVRGWVAGLWRPGNDAAAVPLPRLVVVDYAEAAEPDALRASLEALRRTATAMAPVRVLLLTRTAVGPAGDLVTELGEYGPATLLSILDATTDRSDATRSLTGEQRRTLYDQALSRFTQAWFPDPGKPHDPQTPAPPADLSGDRYALPLEVLFEAFDQALTGDASPAAPGRPPVQRALGHEQKYWDVSAARAVPQMAADLRRVAVALSTLAGAADDSEAHALVAVLSDMEGAPSPGSLPRVVGWLVELYDGPDRLNPLRPDRLGEALISDVLGRQQDGGRGLLTAVLMLPADGQLARCLTVLGRLISADSNASDATAAVLAAQHDVLVARAEARSRGGPGRAGEHRLPAGRLGLLRAAGRPGIGGRAG